jgi:hypothetical protein
MSMDILTEKGKVSVNDEMMAKTIFEGNYPGYQYIDTPKEKPAAFDAVIVKDNTIVGIVETKCRRDMDYEKFKDSYKSQWLVTYKKIRDCCDAADLLSVPFVGFLYIQPSNVLLMKSIYENGKFKQSFSVDQTRTQATTNGGSIVRDNAYIDMTNAKALYLS